jgi:putative nucleotidyltransferase with HDIG domain
MRGIRNPWIQALHHAGDPKGLARMEDRSPHERAHLMIRILFVDDEANVLQAMRRNLHAMRNEWSMEFVSGGVEALAALKVAPADVIVSDMRMPGMDGWQLLAEIRKLYPQTVRLILSGHAEATSIMRAVGIIHQYIAKPCDGAAIRDVIAQTQALRHLVSSDHLAALVGEVGMLPSAPQAFQDLLKCLQNPEASLADAARIIGRDVALTANVMKMVNSAFFGARQPIVTTDRAVAYLGLDTLGALVLGHGIFKSGRKVSIAGFSLERLWAHSLQTAMAAKVIALSERFSSAEAEKAFLAGVLHDVGKIVFATRAQTVSDDGQACREEQAALMEAHHAEVGAYLLSLWGFPNPIVEAVAFHHTPSKASGNALSLPGIVHIASQLVRQKEAPAAIEFDLEPGFLEAHGLVGRLPVWQAAIDKLQATQAAA